MNDLYHRRLPDFEPIDQIYMAVIPRYKTSGLSGDEWRQHVEVKCFFKNILVLSFGSRDVETAAALLSAKIIEWGDNGLPNGMLEREAATCDQPSCVSAPTTYYQLKRLTARTGDYLDMSDQHLRYYRKFCDAHKRRGDCGREDADENYTPISAPTAVAKAGTVQ